MSVSFPPKSAKNILCPSKKQLFTHNLLPPPSGRKQLSNIISLRALSINTSREVSLYSYARFYSAPFRLCSPRAVFQLGLGFFFFVSGCSETALLCLLSVVSTCAYIMQFGQMLHNETVGEGKGCAIILVNPIIYTGLLVCLDGDGEIASSLDNQLLPRYPPPPTLPRPNFCSSLLNPLHNPPRCSQHQSM